VYIGGSGRSGTTLLDRLLGQITGLCAVGEVVHLWRRGVGEGEPCGCGAPFRECGFWSDVGDRAFGGWHAAPAEEVLALERAVGRHRYIPLLLSPGTSPHFDARVARYRDLLGRLYAAIQDAGEGRVIVDSSKSAPHAYVLAGTPGIDLSVLHVVRDSRGVAYSWTKRVPRPEVRGSTSFMPVYHPARAAAEWTADNLLFQLLGRSRRYGRIRYERLVRDPGPVLRGALRMMGLPDGDLPFVRSDHAILDATHSVSGNPMRFQRGRVDLRVDDEWMGHMPAAQRVLVSAMTWPLLVGYGYRPSWR
jgi:hypothetical protein